MSGVTCILGQNALRPSVNLSRDYKIVFYDGQQSYLCGGFRVGEVRGKTKNGAL